MKKVIGFTALFAFCLTLFSFSTAEARKANYNEIKSADFNIFSEAAKFNQYQNSHYTSGEGTWNYRRETWSVNDDNTSIDQLESVINN
jgi:hypothetical protein